MSEKKAKKGGPHRNPIVPDLFEMADGFDRKALSSNRHVDMLMFWERILKDDGKSSGATECDGATAYRNRVLYLGPRCCLLVSVSAKRVNRDSPPTGTFVTSRHCHILAAYPTTPLTHHANSSPPPTPFLCNADGRSVVRLGETRVSLGTIPYTSAVAAASHQNERPRFCQISSRGVGRVRDNSNLFTTTSLLFFEAIPIATDRSDPPI